VPEEGEPVPPLPGGPGRLLVVDDVEANRDLLARRLRQMGHGVETATNGREALERMRAEPFDLVLLDVMMPEMDGLEVLEVLRTEEALRGIPVVMVSAVQEMESVVRCIELGATDYLPKPFNVVLLKARVESSLEKKRLRDREQLHARSLERELEIGRNIQTSFLPRALPGLPGWEIAAALRPARQVGGDFYDAFLLPGGALALVLADVCDKGVGAALFMAVFRSLIRVTSERVAAGGATAGEVLRETVIPINEYVTRTHGDANMFATTFAAVLDPGTGVMAWLNAGHEPPFLRRVGGALSRLPPTGPAVGLLPAMAFGVREELMAHGDLLFAYSDGVTEARAPDGSHFGEERLLALVREGAPSGGPFLARIEDAVAAHAAGAEPSDDLSMLAVRRLS